MTSCPEASVFGWYRFVEEVEDSWSRTQTQALPSCSQYILYPSLFGCNAMRKHLHTFPFNFKLWLSCRVEVTNVPALPLLPATVCLTHHLEGQLCDTHKKNSNDHTDRQTDQNKTAIPGGQEVGPDVEGLIGELEEAEDAVGGWAARVSVPRDDAVLVENLQEEKYKNLVCRFKAVASVLRHWLQSQTQFIISKPPLAPRTTSLSDPPAARGCWSSTIDDFVSLTLGSWKLKVLSVNLLWAPGRWGRLAVTWWGWAWLQQAAV